MLILLMPLKDWVHARAQGHGGWFRGAVRDKSRGTLPPYELAEKCTSGGGSRPNRKRQLQGSYVRCSGRTFNKNSLQLVFHLAFVCTWNFHTSTINVYLFCFLDCVIRTACCRDMAILTADDFHVQICSRELITKIVSTHQDLRFEL